MALSERERAVLDLERTWWQRPGSKGRVIRERLGCSTSRYYQLLAALLEDPDAEEYDPLTVRRVRRTRARRAAARTHAATRRGRR